MTKAEKALSDMHKECGTSMGVQSVKRLLKAMIAGKYYELNVEDFAKTCVESKKIKDTAKALMPYNAANTAAQKSIDEM